LARGRRKSPRSATAADARADVLALTRADDERWRRERLSRRAGRRHRGATGQGGLAGGGSAGAQIRRPAIGAPQAEPPRQGAIDRGAENEGSRMHGHGREVRYGAYPGSSSHDADHPAHFERDLAARTTPLRGAWHHSWRAGDSSATSDGVVEEGRPRAHTSTRGPCRIRSNVSCGHCGIATRVFDTCETTQNRGREDKGDSLIGDKKL